MISFLHITVTVIKDVRVVTVFTRTFQSECLCACVVEDGHFLCSWQTRWDHFLYKSPHTHPPRLHPGRRKPGERRRAELESVGLEVRSTKQAGGHHSSFQFPQAQTISRWKAYRKWVRNGFEMDFWAVTAIQSGMLASAQSENDSPPLSVCFKQRNPWNRRWGVPVSWWCTLMEQHEVTLHLVQHGSPSHAPVVVLLWKKWMIDSLMSWNYWS